MSRKWISGLNASCKMFGALLLLGGSMAPCALAVDLTAESADPTINFKDTSNPGIGWMLKGEDDGNDAGWGSFYLQDRYGNNPFYVKRSGQSGGNNSSAFVIDSDGNIGLKKYSPERQLHMYGSNSVFRMDRTTNTAAFMLVRVDNSPSAMPLKTFVVGTNASGLNTGEFVINDLGSLVTGPGVRRMTIGNTGDVQFEGSVTAVNNMIATAFILSSSQRLKKDISTLTQAREAIEKLRGVRFAWKESGQASVGLIAEEVAKVFPELVLFDGGQAKGVNYNALVAVLIEALKEQDAELATAKRQQQAELSAINARLVELEQMLLGKRAMLSLRYQVEKN